MRFDESKSRDFDSSTPRFDSLPYRCLLADIDTDLGVTKFSTVHGMTGVRRPLEAKFVERPFIVSYAPSAVALVHID
jgi:hypothetical protein